MSIALATKGVIGGMMAGGGDYPYSYTAETTVIEVDAGDLQVSVATADLTVLVEVEDE